MNEKLIQTTFLSRRLFPFGMKRHFLDHVQTLYDMTVCLAWASEGITLFLRSPSNH